jgi:glucose-6-phosphate 1-dehydrogenase
MLLLFGSRGHLARTKIIPILKKRGVPWIPMSRQVHTDLSNYSNNTDNVAYMSIPTVHLLECIEPYEDFVVENKPTFVLEKPHGNSPDNFEKIKKYFFERDLQVLYNDHYIARDNITSPVVPKKIEIVLHESLGVEDRMEYFDNTGIILDMYQSHAVVLAAMLISNSTGVSRTEVLEEISRPFILELSRYEGYQGKAYTGCEIRFYFRDTEINVSCAKKTEKTEKYISVNDGEHTIDISQGTYEKIIDWIIEKNTKPFLNHYEVSLLWKHTG